MFGTLVDVFVFSVMWPELLMTSAICCPLWSSVYKCHKVECAFTFPMRNECAWYVCDVLYVVLYVCVTCFVVRGCTVSRRYIDVYILSVYCPFSDRVGLPLHNILSPFLSVMAILFVDLKFCHIHFYTL